MALVSVAVAKSIRAAYLQVAHIRAVYADAKFNGQHITLYVVTEKNDPRFQMDSYNAETSLEALYPDVFFVAQNRLLQGRDVADVFAIPADQRIL